MKRAIAALAVAATLIAGQAQAQALFSGDCDRARAMQASIPLSQRFSGRYTGVTAYAADGETCGRLNVRAWDITPRSADASRVTYDLKAADYRIRKTKGDCPDAAMWNNELYGTITFEYSVINRGGYCDLRVMALFFIKTPSVPTWSDTYTQAVIFLDSTHFSTSSDGVFDGTIFFK